MSNKWHHNFPKIAREAGFTIRELSIGHCIDWRFVASIDPYSIVSEQDYEKLDEFIPHISEVPIGTVLNNRILDPAIGKYFILAQFSIQYLLFCKQFLDETVVEIRHSLQNLQQEKLRLERVNKKRLDEIAALQRKLQHTETINHQQLQPTTSFPCTKCTKNFISVELMNAHMIRKHATNAHGQPYSYERKSSNTDTSLINTIKLELEVKQLKERLNIAEKDLLHQRAQHHRCHVCSEDSHSKPDKVQDKILQSVAIQTNLTDDKDVNDKEAQTQTETLLVDRTNILPNPPTAIPTGETISKSDLQSFIDEQKMLFEHWKDEERDKFNEEMAAVKQNLVDTISTLQKSGQTPTQSVCDDAAWSERYQGLEKMLQNSQNQTRDTITTFERAYTQKIDHIEKLLTNMLQPPNKEIIPKPPERVATTPQTLRMITLPEIVIDGEDRGNGQKTTATSDNSKKKADNSYSESEETESGDEFRAEEPSHMFPSKPEPSVDRVPYTTPIESSKTLPAVSLSLSPKKQILNQFRARLKMIGIHTKSEKLSSEGLNAACEALAARRDTMKKNHKHYFITRNHLLSKVDQMARLKIAGQTSQLSRESNIADEKSLTQTKASPSKQLQPTKQALSFPAMSSFQKKEMNVFKTKSATKTSLVVSSPSAKLADDDIIIIHAEQQPTAASKSTFMPPSPSPIPNKRAIENYDMHVEKLLDTPIKTVKSVKPAKARQVEQSEESIERINSELSETLDAIPALPKPIPKKRVLFNLDKRNDGSINGAASNNGHKIELGHLKQEEESDWNISSFDEDK